MSALYLSDLGRSRSKSLLLQRYPETDRALEKLPFWTSGTYYFRFKSDHLGFVWGFLGLIAIPAFLVIIDCMVSRHDDMDIVCSWMTGRDQYTGRNTMLVRNTQRERAEIDSAGRHRAERERDIQTDRRRDRETDRQRHDRERDRQTDRQIDILDRETDRQR